MSWLGVLGRHATKFLAASVFLALALPDLASLMRPLLAPSVWGILVLAMLRTDWQVFGGHLKNPHRIVASLAWLLLACPLAIWLTLKALGLDLDGVGGALVLMVTAPPLMSTPALALIIGLDSALALVVMLAAMFFAPLVLPVMILGLLGLEIELSLWEFAGRLIFVVGSALLAALVLRRWKHFPPVAAVSRNANGLVVILMLIFAIAIMDGVTTRLLAEPLYVAALLALSFIVQALLQTLTALGFLWLGRRAAFTVGFLAGNRNMGLLLVVLPAGLHPDIALYFAMAQFPIYILPALLKPLYGRLLPVK
jgi:BASS family bile acid:Na+ symporter